MKFYLRNNPIIIKRGEIYLVDWNLARGSEQEGVRPALVIQNNTGNEHSSTTIVAAISKKFKEEYPFQVFISAKYSGLDSDSIIDLGQIMTIDKTRLRKKIGGVKETIIEQINRAIAISLNI